MFVSILQRFGFKASRQSGQPLQSRADLNTQPRASAEAHPEAASQRRQAVKAKPVKKTQPASKATNKVLAKAPTKAAAKAASKGVKAVAKPKAPAKTAAKGSFKAAPKAKAKPVVKTAVKAVAKSAAKKPVAKSKTPVKKPVAKPTLKSIVKKPIAKAVAKPLVKLVLKPTPKVTAKLAANAVSKAPLKLAKPEKVLSEKVLPKGKKAAMPATAAALATPVSPKPVAAVSSNGLPPPPPLKPGRRSSSRALAHMPPPAPMVPTHAPDAAKASYSIMTERVIAPPPHVAAKKDPKLANNWKTKAAETLTDEEVKAMPDAEYMNDKQMAFFRFKLSILKQDIHNSAGATTEHLREDTAVVPDPADRATIEEEHALELRTRDRERKLLKKIEQSIARIDSGDYGYCDETGEPIGVGRLIARPTASLSLEAQQRRELKQKMFGD